MLDDGDVAAVFGLEMAETASFDTPTPTVPKRPQRSRKLRQSKTPAAESIAAAKKSSPHRVTRAKSETMGNRSQRPEKARAAAVSGQSTARNS